MANNHTKEGSTMKTMKDWTEEDLQKARTLVKTVLSHIGKISRYRWRVFADDLVDNALARSWRDIYRLGEDLDLDAPSDDHLRIIADNCKLARSDAQHFPEFIYSVREMAGILDCSIGTAHAWTRGPARHDLYEIVRGVIAACRVDRD